MFYRRRSNRNRSGSVLVLVIVTAVAALLLLLNAVPVAVQAVMAQRGQNAAEAAALAAASELSRIVIDDEYFGYVSLADSPPVNAEAVALDGECAPVTGINTIVSNARQAMIVADLVGNEYMFRRAKLEMMQARRAARRLEETMQQSLRPHSRRADRDKVDPYIRALDVLKQNRSFQSGVAPELSLSLGWSEDCGTTTSDAPRPRRYSFCHESLLNGSHYSPSLNTSFKPKHIAGDEESFYFAAAGSRLVLTRPKHFSKPDGVHIASLVRARLKSTLCDQTISLCAYAQPISGCDSTPASSLIVDLGDHSFLESTSLRQLLNSASKTLTLHCPRGGDFPRDDLSKLDPAILDTGEQTLSIRDVLGLALFDWLRTAHRSVDIETLLIAIDTDLKRQSARFHRFDIGRDGRVILTPAKTIAFSAENINEDQLYCYAPSIDSGHAPAAITVFDHVHRLGTTHGGAHAGQPVAGESINWIELQAYDGSRELAQVLGRGADALGIEACGKASSVAPGGITSTGSSLTNKNGGPLVQQARKTYYSGGLGVLIQLSRAL